MGKVLLLIGVSLFFTATYGQNERVSEVDSILISIQGDPDWALIDQTTKDRFGQHKGDSIGELAKIQYYFSHGSYSEYVEKFIRFNQVYNPRINANRKNSNAWRVVQYASAIEHLKQAEVWILEAMDIEPSNPFFIDTYANILYKMGNKKRAIQLQTYAATSALAGNGVSALVENLYCMRNNLPTWKYPVPKQKPSDFKSQNAEWSALEQEFIQKTHETIWEARLNRTKSTGDKRLYSQTIMAYMKEINEQNVFTLNEYAWEIFQHSDDRVELKRALSWSERALKVKGNNAAMIDTYANLLYKLGKQKDAIAWETKAVLLCSEDQKTSYGATLTRIKMGEKTWP